MMYSKVLIVLVATFHITSCKVLPKEHDSKLSISDQSSGLPLESMSLIGSPKKTPSKQTGDTFSRNINAIIDDRADTLELGTDYDFVLNLDEKDDFDRLLSLLSRSGPAKHSDEVSSSAFNIY